MLKLALCHPFLYTKGGAERVVLKIAQHYNAPIYCSIYSPEKTFPEFKEMDMHVLGGKMPQIFPKRIQDAMMAGIDYYKLKISDYDIINAHGTPSEWARHRNAPVLWYCHTPNREAFDLYEWRMSKRNILQKALYWSSIQPYKILESKTVPNIEYIFVNSANTQGRVKKYLMRKSEVLNPGTEVDSFYCTDYEKFFLYPSRITPEKQFEYAIEAFRKFKKSATGWKLVIAGALIQERPEHLTYFKKIQKMAQDVGDIEILLDLDDKKIKDLYSRCACVVYSPVDEDYGLVPTEAFSASKAVISINEGGPKEVLTSETGFLVNSPAEMAEKMKFISENINIAEEMGKNARKRAEKCFTWDHFFERFDKVAIEIAKKQQY